MDENNWNPPSRPKRNDASRGGGSPRTRAATRTNPLNINLPSASAYIDDVTINAVLTSSLIDNIGPGNFTQFRVPMRNSSGYINANETFGEQSEFAFSWMAKHIGQGGGRGAAYARLKKFEKELTSNVGGQQFIEEEDEPLQKDPRFLLSQLAMAEQNGNPQVASDREESIMEWFDRCVEKELRKRKELDTEVAGPLFDVIPPPKDLNVTKALLDRMSEASSSRVEICTQMRMTPDTELTEAADKYAKAEAMCAFAGAVRAAEAAAEGKYSRNVY
ncbi:unnamed protein product [Acanthoscelides obtectus]|uniref:Uncharacterized protein n=1 Tax=Acanthoscelides obtectus TaxID=200917 RepID=A0A9P0LEI7_ACAOB|nr:unnamed protein product [Acanthoscelides obtectus]CAK1663300.1 hypothetical protein AOBTE_LOCUS23603 [Acanthoscelides obtectus]